MKRPVNGLLVWISSNADRFGRQGHNKTYRMGELSHAVLEETVAPSCPLGKYHCWAGALFKTLDSPKL